MLFNASIALPYLLIVGLIVTIVIFTSPFGLSRARLRSVAWAVAKFLVTVCAVVLLAPNSRVVQEIASIALTIFILYMAVCLFDGLVRSASASIPVLWQGRAREYIVARPRNTKRLDLSARDGFIPSSIEHRTLSVLGDVDLITFRGDVETENCSRFLADLQVAAKSTRPRVVIFLHTYGGDLYDHYTIRRAIRELNSRKPVDIMVTGHCASAGITILTSVPLANRFAADNSSFMIHASTEPFSQDEVLGPFNEKLLAELCAETAIEPGSLRRLYASRQDFEFDASVAIELGLIGHIVS